VHLRLETQPREDGVLPTAIFRRVFISYRNQFAILRAVIGAGLANARLVATLVRVVNKSEEFVQRIKQPRWSDYFR
jgi:hypothetical protein